MRGKGKPFTSDDPRINRAGRPVGSKDQKWYDLRWWFKLIEDNYDQLKPAAKVELGLRGLAILIGKLPNIPASPQESKDNAILIEQQEKELEAAENASHPQ